MSVATERTRERPGTAPHYWVDRAGRGERPHAAGRGVGPHAAGRGERPHAVWSVLRRRTIVRLALAVVLLVAYGTMMPFGAGAPERLAASGGLLELAAWRPVFGLDACANVLVFVPIGVALRLLLRRPPVHAGREVLAVTLAALVLSLALEMLQTLRFERRPDPRDCLTNCLGAFLGAFAATWLQARARSIGAELQNALRSRSAAAAAFVAVTVLAAAQAMVAVRDATTLVARSEYAGAAGDAATSAAWCWIEVPAVSGAFALVGYLCGRALAGGPRNASRAPAIASLLGAALLALLPALGPAPLEGGKLVSYVAAAAIGLWLGRGAAPWLARRLRSRWSRVALATAFLIQGLTAFHRADGADPVGLVLLPLHSAFPRAWALWLADLGTGTIWLAAGVVLLRYRHGVPARWTDLTSGALVCAAYAVAQLAVRYYTGSWTDSVTLAVVVLAAWLATSSRVLMAPGHGAASASGPGPSPLQNARARKSDSSGTR